MVELVDSVVAEGQKSESSDSSSSRAASLASLASRCASVASVLDHCALRLTWRRSLLTLLGH